MTNLQTIDEYIEAINAEIDSITHQETKNTVLDLLDYASKTKSKKEAQNREQRPRPDGEENIAYYRSEIDFNYLPSDLLKTLINNLFDAVEELEQELSTT
ncbi:MAG: hypothetical protein AAFZ15_28115 [Bacteroidota bacterium]